MKFSSEVDIDVGIDRVIELFDDPANLKHWQPGLLSFERLSGETGHPGAKSRLKFKIANRDIEMIETVTVRNFPKEFSGTYESNGVFNTVKNSFLALSPTKTRYISEQEFHFSGFMKVVAFTMPGIFKSSADQFLQQFKVFAEDHERPKTPIKEGANPFNEREAPLA